MCICEGRRRRRVTRRRRYHDGRNLVVVVVGTMDGGVDRRATTSCAMTNLFRDSGLPRATADRKSVVVASREWVRLGESRLVGGGTSSETPRVCAKLLTGWAPTAGPEYEYSTHSTS